MTRPQRDGAVLEQLPGPTVVQKQPQAGIDDEQRGRKAFEDRDEGTCLLFRGIDEFPWLRAVVLVGFRRVWRQCRMPPSERLTDPYC